MMDEVIAFTTCFAVCYLIENKPRYCVQGQYVGFCWLSLECMFVPHKGMDTCVQFHLFAIFVQRKFAMKLDNDTHKAS